VSRIVDAYAAEAAQTAINVVATHVFNPANNIRVRGQQLSSQFPRAQA
jgi:hypothetical protein